MLVCIIILIIIQHVVFVWALSYSLGGYYCPHLVIIVYYNNVVACLAFIFDVRLSYYYYVFPVLGKTVLLYTCCGVCI